MSIIDSKDRGNMIRGIQSLRQSHVEPMLLSLTPHHWWFSKFKALPTHPSSGNAGRGFSHPTNPQAFDLSHGDSPHLDFGKSDDETIRTLIKSLARDLEISTPFNIDISRFPDGQVTEVTLVRSGVINFEDYPDSNLPREIENVDGHEVIHFGGKVEKDRVRKLRAGEAKLPPVLVDMREMGRRGGAATKGISTPAKRRAARENGKRGGRPKGSKDRYSHQKLLDKPNWQA